MAGSQTRSRRRTPSSEVVIVTGAGGYLGMAIARWWARSAKHLILLDRSAERLALCQRHLRSVSSAVVTIAEVDLTDTERTRSIVEAIPPASRPPALVLAHGVAGRTPGLTRRLGTLELSDWRQTLDELLTSNVFTVQAFLGLMERAGGGRIVLISSTAGLMASPTASMPYAIAKAAVAVLPRLLAPELARRGILINAVAPGKCGNPAWPDDDSALEDYVQSVPVGRLATAADVADLVGFLSSETNTYVTGQTIVQDGGRLSVAPGVGSRS